MKRVLKCQIVFNFIMLIFVCLPSMVCAQGDPGCDPFGYRCVAYDNSTPPVCISYVLCPIDNGLILLLAIGVLYGIIKYRVQKNRLNSANKREQIC